MTSFNHYALGAVADWLHRFVGGLAPAVPGYRHITIRPRPGGGLTLARVRHRTPYGQVACSWQIDSEAITVQVEIPANTWATVELPGTADPAFQVGSGHYEWTYPYRSIKPDHPTLSLDSLLGELVEDDDLYTQIIKILAQHNPELADQLRSQSDMTLRQAAALNPNSDELLARLEAALLGSETHQ
jgi:alpha-L-rhamnosidase